MRGREGAKEKGAESKTEGGGGGGISNFSKHFCSPLPSLHFLPSRDRSERDSGEFPMSSPLK